MRKEKKRKEKKRKQRESGEYFVMAFFFETK